MGDGRMNIIYQGGKPLARSRAPLRLGLGGGGTDLPDFIQRSGGLVFNATINLSAHCTVFGSQHDYFEANDLGLSDGNMLPLHTSSLRFFREKYLSDRDCSHISIITSCDAPIGSGLGSSSAVVVAIVACLAEYFDVKLSRSQLAWDAIEIERKVLRFEGGYQDQFAAAYGGFNLIEFRSLTDVVVNTLRVPEEVVFELEASALLYFTGRSRVSAQVINSQLQNIHASKASTIHAFDSLKQVADSMRCNLLSGDLGGFWSGLRDSWQHKKATSDSISNDLIFSIERVVDRFNGLGFKISGAGGGGFCLIGCRPESRLSLERELTKLGGACVPFRFVQDGVTAWSCN